MRLGTALTYLNSMSLKTFYFGLCRRKMRVELLGQMRLGTAKFICFFSEAYSEHLPPLRYVSFVSVAPYIDKPTYSTRRRTQSKNRPTANSVFHRDSTDTFIFCSESLSTASSTPSIHSETSEPMSLDLSPREIIPQVTSEIRRQSTCIKNAMRPL